MSSSIIPLCDVSVGKNCIVCSLLAIGHDRRRLLDLGLIIGTKVEALSRSPAGDPSAYFIRGAVIALRKEDAAKIMVKKIPF